MSEEFLGNRRDALVEEFFHKKDQEKLHAIRSELERKKTLDELRDAACIGDDLVLEGFYDAGLSGDTVTAIALVPLVHVAWADGVIQNKERQAILDAARTKGIADDSPAAVLLADWLHDKEPAHLFETWKQYIHALSAKLDPKVREALSEQIVGFAKQTAESAGGILGIGSISKTETDALEQIAEAFKA